MKALHPRIMSLVQSSADQQGCRACEVFSKTQGDAQFHIRVGSGKNVSLHVWDTEVEV